MRNLGAILLLAGVLGFFMASQRLEESGPAPADLSLVETLEQPAGRWDLARYAAALSAGVGVVLVLFPKGR